MKKVIVDGQEIEVEEQVIEESVVEETKVNVTVENKKKWSIWKALGVGAAGLTALGLTIWGFASKAKKNDDSAEEAFNEDDEFDLTEEVESDINPDSESVITTTEF